MLRQLMFMIRRFFFSETQKSEDVFVGESVLFVGERGGSGVECRTPEREVRGSRPTSAVLCP